MAARKEVVLGGCVPVTGLTCSPGRRYLVSVNNESVGEILGIGAGGELDYGADIADLIARFHYRSVERVLRAVALVDRALCQCALRDAFSVSIDAGVEIFAIGVSREGPAARGSFEVIRERLRESLACSEEVLEQLSQGALQLFDEWRRTEKERQDPGTE